MPNILEYVDSAEEVKFIVALRNPVEMAVSLHGQRMRGGFEVERDFEKAWQLQQKRANDKLTGKLFDVDKLMYGKYCQLGEQVQRLLRLVNRKQVHFILLEDVKADPHAEYLRVLAFLGLPEDGREIFPVYNKASSLPLWVAVLHRWILNIKGFFEIRHGFGFMRKLMQATTNKIANEPISSKMLVDIKEYFKEDIILLGKILDRDLTQWYR